MKGFITKPSYTILNDQTHVQLFGRLENNESFVAMINFNPYFFIPEKDLKKVKKIIKEQEFDFKIEETSLKNFRGGGVIKISYSNHIELNKLSKQIHKEEIETYEADLNPDKRYLLDKDIYGSIELKGDYNASERIDRVYKNPEIEPTEFKPKLKVASVDIETDSKENLLCIGISS
mgnify:FL=1